VNNKMLALCTAVLFTSGSAFAAGDPPHWSYSGHGAPEHWGDLDPAFAACKSGKNQSPIDLKGFIEAELPPIGIAYETEASEILNNGHTIQVNVAPGSKITLDETAFELKQFHFHSPSENTIEGRPFDLEAHFVHADAEGNLAVIGVMFKEGAANLTLAELWKEMPKQAGEKAALKSKADPNLLLPADRDYYRFNGSLTTPPCTEGVRWLVMKQPLTLSKGQVDAFLAVMHHENNRPVQPVHARPVLQ
jgi:carbonic anhydrase